MIRRSFVILEKIGRRKEHTFWQQGILTWNDFLQRSVIKDISPQKKKYYDRKIKDAQQALVANNSAYFKTILPARETWRLYSYFSEECGFLDIETDSLGRITIVGVSNYYQTNTFVQGFNLEKRNLETALGQFKLLVTFNGASFDLPKLKKQFGVTLAIPHLDLKPLCVQLGWKGGLKEVEKMLDLKRPAQLYGNPVDLWKAFHASGDREYLDLLIDYNTEDTENLKMIVGKVVKILAERTMLNA